MEIGEAGKLSTYEKEYYVKKAISLSITAFLLIMISSYLIIVNYTSLFEMKLFEYMSNKYGYELSYSNNYEVLSRDNEEQGNYIQLSDKKNNIYILFRYDENSFKIMDFFDEVTHTKSMYEITTKIDTNKHIRSEEDILFNIDREFSSLSSSSVLKDRENVGGGYSIVKIDTVMNQHRIDYTSNLLKTISDKTNKSKHDNSMTSPDDVMAIKNWFNYDNTINYQLNILKAIVETEADYDSSTQIMYSGGANTDATIIDSVKDSTEVEEENNKDKKKDDTKKKKDNSKVDESLEGFINNKDEILDKYGEQQYSTYTSLVLSNSGDNLSTDALSNGVVMGMSINSDEAVNKMVTTMNMLIIISYLEKTILL